MSGSSQQLTLKKGAPGDPGLEVIKLVHEQPIIELYFEFETVLKARCEICYACS